MRRRLCLARGGRGNATAANRKPADGQHNGNRVHEGTTFLKKTNNSFQHIQTPGSLLQGKSGIQQWIQGFTKRPVTLKGQRVLGFEQFLASGIQFSA